MTEEVECEANGKTMMLLHTLVISNVEVVNSVLNGCRLLEILYVRFHLFPDFFAHVHKADRGLLQGFIFI